MLSGRLVLTLAFSVTVSLASCAELPETQLKSRGGASGGGVPGVGQAGSAHAGSGAGAGSAGRGGAGAPSTGGTAGSAGRSGGTGGGGTSDANAGETSSDAGAAGAAGASGENAVGASGSGGSGGSGTSGSGGSSAGSGGFSTNRDDFFGDSRCQASKFALCEDFESGTLDTSVWHARGAGPTIETTRAARGKHSAHFHTDDNGLSYITQTKTFPAPNDRYYARLFVWFDALPTAPAWAHWTLSGAQEGTASDAAEIRVGGQLDSNQGMNLFGVGTDRGPTGDWTNLDADPKGQKPKAVPEHEWQCIEWMFDGSANQTKFWWDGVEHPSLATSETSHGGTDDPFVLPNFDSMWVGWWLYQSGTEPPQFDVWIDEIAVDYARIGCEH